MQIIVRKRCMLNYKHHCPNSAAQFKMVFAFFIKFSRALSLRNSVFVQETYRIIRGIHHWSLETANRVRGTSRAIPKHVLPQFYRRRNGWHGERLLEHATQLVTKTAVPDEDVYRLMWNQKQDDGVRRKSIDWRLQPRQFQLPRPHHRFVSLARDRNLIN